MRHNQKRTLRPSRQGKTLYGVLRDRCLSDGKEQRVFHPDAERKDRNAEPLLPHAGRLNRIAGWLISAEY
jgi:hypothetical protein